MGIEDVKARARARASAIQLDDEASQPVERLRSEAMAFFARVPEPPVYRRRDDPAIAVAHVLAVDGEKLLGEAYALEGRAPEGALAPWVLALERHLAALVLMREGKVEAAEAPWREALAAERTATSAKRLWSRSDDDVLPVFDRAGARSRFDPVPEASMKVKLVCPRCQKNGEYACSPRLATHPFTCTACSSNFSAYFAEVRVCEVRKLSRGRRYVFRLDELNGAQTQLHVDDGGRDALTVARRDFLAFLYAPATELRGVLNLSSSHVLWLTASRCFVATVAFEREDAPELDVLRAFRDQVLAESIAGRAFIASYYRHGPSVAQFVARHASVKHVTRAVLSAAVAALRSRGFR